MARCTGCVLADAGCGKTAEFRLGPSEWSPPWAVGILPAREVYPSADVTLSSRARKPTGRPRKHPMPSAASVATAELPEAGPGAFRTVTWQAGAKGPLRAGFAALRARVAWPTVALPHVGSTYLAGRCGSSASAAPGASASATCPTCRPTCRSKGWRRWSRHALG